MVNAKDGEGVRDVQIWAAGITWTTDPNTGTTTQFKHSKAGETTTFCLPLSDYSETSTCFG